MVDLAKVAAENKISLEVKKDGLQQRQNGDWVLRFTAQNIEMDQILSNAKMGTRFWMSLIELNDDETPVDHKAAARDKWADLGPARQAGMRCKEPIFWAFLSEKFEGPKIGSEEAAASLVRDLCAVTSRSELSKPGNQKQRILWHQLDNAYQGWKARENA